MQHPSNIGFTLLNTILARYWHIFDPLLHIQTSFRNHKKGEISMGRMRENPRYNVISMRISDAEREQLEHLVRRTRKSVSDIMREAMINLTAQGTHPEMRHAA